MLRTFNSEYRDLEAKMRALAVSDGDVFLPNPTPSGPAHHIFICMEPSLGSWARSRREAEAKVARGFRNFHHSAEDFLLHFAIRRYLLRPGESYHLTDVSKGAMLVVHAGRDRSARYARWYELLRQELDLVAAPDARVFSVGSAVGRFLERQDFAGEFTRILHYSGLAAKARAAGIMGHEEAFDQFSGTVTLDDVVAEANEALDASLIPKPFRSEALGRLENSRLSVSRMQLLFNYKISFERDLN